MAWEAYNLDRTAHDLVLAAFQQDADALNQTHKMRTTVAFGLERFWGEQIREKGSKSDFWRETWTALCSTMSLAGITLPSSQADPKELWELPIAHRKVTLAVLTQLCDAMVWWSQRYKGSDKNNGSKGDKS